MGDQNAQFLDSKKSLVLNLPVLNLYLDYFAFFSDYPVGLFEANNSTIPYVCIVKETIVHRLTIHV